MLTLVCCWVLLYSCISFLYEVQIYLSKISFRRPNLLKSYWQHLATYLSPFYFFCNSFLGALPYTSDGQADALEGNSAAQLCQQAICDCSRSFFLFDVFYWAYFAICSTLEVNASVVPQNHRLAARANGRTNLSMSRPSLLTISSLMAEADLSVRKEQCLLWEVFDWSLPFRTRNLNGQRAAWYFHVSKGGISQTVNLTIDWTSRLCHISAAGRTFFWH